MARACPRWRGEIGAYIVGALDPDAAAAVRQHLARCADCRAEYDELAPLRGVLDRCAGRDSAPPRRHLDG
jgi:anti-sigma factor RsiW